MGLKQKNRTYARLLFLIGTACLFVTGIVFYVSVSADQSLHPFRDDIDSSAGNVPRDLVNPSIREDPSGKRSAGYKEDVEPRYGNIPASYEWFGGMFPAIGSEIKPFEGDPTWAGWKNFYVPGFDFWRIPWQRGSGQPDTSVTDTPSLGVPCRGWPGDAYWVGYPRVGNVEIPPPFQWFHHEYDCYCRCHELVFCPIRGPYGWSGWRRGPQPGPVPCQVCFGIERIRKHDVYVGTHTPVHMGYPSMPYDPGYRECLRQSPESYAASGPGGQPIDHNIHGL